MLDFLVTGLKAKLVSPKVQPLVLAVGDGNRQRTGLIYGGQADTAAMKAWYGITGTCAG